MVEFEFKINPYIFSKKWLSQGSGVAPLAGSRGSTPCGVQGVTPLAVSRGSAPCGGPVDRLVGKGQGGSAPGKNKNKNKK